MEYNFNLQTNTRKAKPENTDVLATLPKRYVYSFRMRVFIKVGDIIQLLHDKFGTIQIMNKNIALSNRRSIRRESITTGERDPIPRRNVD